MNPKIFISYRRADSQDFADRLYDHMVRHFGEDSVFQDVGDSSKIPLGVDFVEYLDEQVQRCDVVLVVIGEQWVRLLRERLNREDDFVRIEVESALQQKKIIIPVLKSGSHMPASDELPMSIQSLARRNASRVRPNPDFSKDCDTLAEGIRAVFERAKTAFQPHFSRSRVPNLIPSPFAWADIPAGQVILQNLWGDKKDYIGQSKIVEVPAFQIAKYPVTNAQFATFMEAGGYHQKRWWTDEGWMQREEEGWKEPGRWQDQERNSAEQPVIEVSWYEAIAFCQWLSEVSSEKIILPTEAQWQRAAQGDDGRIYPWGNEWDCERCNNFVPPCGTRKTSPVTVYEGKGDSPFGVVDMAGNVWEWCLTVFETGGNEINITHTNSMSRVMRGGSWDGYHTENFRVAYRNGSHPMGRGFSRGFRICRAD